MAGVEGSKPPDHAFRQLTSFDPPPLTFSFDKAVASAQPENLLDGVAPVKMMGTANVFLTLLATANPHGFAIATLTKETIIGSSIQLLLHRSRRSSVAFRTLANGTGSSVIAGQDEVLALCESLNGK